MKKFIKGSFELDKNVINLIEYEEKHKQAINEILNWAERFDVDIYAGTSNDNTYLIEFNIVGNTQEYCRGLLSELKLRLKNEWKKTKLVWQTRGNYLY